MSRQRENHAVISDQKHTLLYIVKVQKCIYFYFDKVSLTCAAFENLTHCVKLSLQWGLRLYIVSLLIELHNIAIAMVSLVQSRGVAQFIVVGILNPGQGMAQPLIEEISGQ